jgi:hypothetical protein
MYVFVLLFSSKAAAFFVVAGMLPANVVPVMMVGGLLYLYLLATAQHERQ